jgi:NSS family neurotransmitter:Na+ symporter
MRALAKQEGKHPSWQLLGWMGIVTGFLILSFYSVVAGWTIAYAVRAASGVFSGIDAAGAKAVFDGLVGDAERQLAWHTIFMTASTLVVARGVASGLEKAVRFLMPALFVLLVLMVIYSFSAGDFGRAVSYMFAPDFSKLSGDAILEAMGQAFFSLSLGMGAIMIYGSYLHSEASIGSNTVIIAGMDTLVAVLAGLAIFPIVFANDLAPGGGPGLVFQVLPIAFGQMPGGVLFSTLFFVLLVFAAWTSGISLLEPMVAWLVENRGFSRVRASVLVGIAVWLLGIACLLSFNEWSQITVFGKVFFDLFDYLTANILLPLGGVLIAVFSGWVLSRGASVDELAMGEGAIYRVWRVLIRYIAPLAVALVFLNAVGLI